MRRRVPTDVPRCAGLPRCAAECFQAGVWRRSVHTGWARREVRRAVSSRVKVDCTYRCVRLGLETPSILSFIIAQPLDMKPSYKLGT